MKNIAKRLSLFVGILLLPLFVSCGPAKGSAAISKSPQPAAAQASDAAAATETSCFADASLEKAVRAALKKPSGALTDEDFASITEFSYTGSVSKPLSSLEGIEQLENLESLAIEDAGLTDLGALASLRNLKSLSLRSNRIRSLAPLSQLTRLEKLDLIHNLIQDVSPLSGMENLSELFLDFNLVSDLTPLGGLTKLTQLGFTGNKVTDLQFLASLPGMQCLYMSGNNGIKDYSPIAGLASIRRISVDFVNRDDLAVLQSFPALYSVTFYGTEVTPAPDQLNPDLAPYDELLVEADRVLNSVVTAGMTDYEKESAIYSYVVDNVVYGYIDGDQENSAYSARGALIHKKCVCMGFSNAMCLVMNKAGIDCISVNDNADHAWNIVKLDDGYYHVDASRASMNHAKDRYLNMTDEVAKQDRKWDSASYPACAGTKYAVQP